MSVLIHFEIIVFIHDDLLLSTAMQFGHVSLEENSYENSV